MFEQFWNKYPRRESKADARKAFSKIPESEQQKIIPALEIHCKRWEILQTEKHWIPLPATWLRGERWYDEIEIPQPVLRTTNNVIEFAKKKNIEARVGESMSEFEQRVRMTR